MKRIFNTMLMAAVVLTAAGCGNGKKEKADAQVQEVIPAVSVETVSVREVPQIATYTSTVEPYAKNNISPQSGGRITKINVEVGDFVKKGQIVAEIDKTQLLQIELQMKNNEIEYNRLKGLYDAGGLSQSDLDAIELAYKVSKTNYENLLENSVLISPINGVITARNYDVGDMFTMGQPIYTVQQITPVKLIVGISEVDYTKVKKGDKVELTVDAIPDKVFSGKVNRIYPTVDVATRTFSVEIIVENADRVLRPGMFARVSVNFGVNNSVVVPDLAVVKQSGSGERFIYVLKSDNTVEYRKVTLGRRMGTEYEVLEGIEDGAKVVTKGQSRLKDGVKVRVN